MADVVPTQPERFFTLYGSIHVGGSLRGSPPDFSNVLASGVLVGNSSGTKYNVHVRDYQRQPALSAEVRPWAALESHATGMARAMGGPDVRVVYTSTRCYDDGEDGGQLRALLETAYRQKIAEDA